MSNKSSTVTGNLLQRRVKKSSLALKPKNLPVIHLISGHKHMYRYLKLALHTTRY